MIIVDLEASGLDPDKHGILSIGALDFDNPKNQFYGECRLRDGAGFDVEALNVCGFSEETLRDSKKQSEKELITGFFLWSSSIADRTLSSQNIGTLDWPMLKLGFARYGLTWPFGWHSVDVHSVGVSAWKTRGWRIPSVNGVSNLTIDTMLNALGIPEEPRPHNALTGAKVEAEILARIWNRAPLLDEFRAFGLPIVWQERK
jgi:DNA polymerase III epsilon subunit-like protein